MAILRPVRATGRPPYLKGAFLVDTWRGLLRARTFPRPRKKRISRYERSIRDAMNTVTKFAKYVLPIETHEMREAVKRHNKAHEGLKGSAILRFEDLEHMRLTGRLLNFILQDGTRLYSLQSWEDVSNTLDWLCDERGAVLSRGPTLWGGSLACGQDYVLTIRDTENTDDTCAWLSPPPDPNSPVPPVSLTPWR